MPSKLLRLAIDANEANITKRVGSNVYAFELLKAMHELTRQQSDIDCTLLLSRAPIDDLPQETSRWKYRVVTPQRFWTQWALPLHLLTHRDQFDLFFTPGHYAPRFCPLPYISSVMDTAYLDFPNQFTTSDYLQLKHWTQFSVRHARRVIAISKSTKRAVVDAYGIPSDHVVVAYPGFATGSRQQSHNKQSLMLKELGVHEPYFLFVGTIQPRKNLEKLIESYEIFVQMFWSRTLTLKGGKSANTSPPTPQLVIAGKTGWLAQPVLKRVADSPEKESIILTGFVSEDQKNALLHGARATILIGLHEGFGIPPLESMAAGTVPIVADTTSLPEVVGQAGITVNPLAEQEIAKALWQAYALTAKQRAVFRRRMREQVAKFSWQKAARIVIDTLRAVAVEERA